MFEALMKFSLEHQPFVKPVFCSTAASPDTDRDEDESRVAFPMMMSTLCPTRSIAAAAADGAVQYGTPKYYLFCALGGALACGLTHTGIVSLDLVKCRMQTNKEKYPSIFKAIAVSFKEGGIRGLSKGWAPTALGYSAQGFYKFGFYEFFKSFYSSLFEPETAYIHRTLIYLAASASAEFIADIALSPMESVKVRMQTNDSAPRSMFKALPQMIKQDGIGVLYKAIGPLWLRQIPYTMMKFATFERTLEYLYKNLLKKPRDQVEKWEQLSITFAAGYIAGIFCAIVSHPADVLVSKMNKEHVPILTAIKVAGIRGLWSGIIPRIVMIGTLTGAQWFIYDAFKVEFGVPRPPPPEPPLSLLLKQKIEHAGHVIEDTTHKITDGAMKKVDEISREVAPKRPITLSERIEEIKAQVLQKTQEATDDANKRLKVATANRDAVMASAQKAMGEAKVDAERKVQEANKEVERIQNELKELGRKD